MMSFQVNCVVAQARSTYVFDMLKVYAPPPPLLTTPHSILLALHPRPRKMSPSSPQPLNPQPSTPHPHPPQARGDGTFEVDVVCGGDKGVRTDIIGGVSAAYSLSDANGRKDFMNLPKVLLGGCCLGMWSFCSLLDADGTKEFIIHLP